MLEKFITEVQRFREFGDKYFGERSVIQSPNELLGFSNVLLDMGKRDICLEIGLFHGGTHVFFKQFFAEVISMEVDAQQCSKTGVALRAFGLDMNGSHLICCNSHSDDAVAAVKDILNGALLDCLFVDGGHDYASVKTDYEKFECLVRTGGVIAFHDAGSEEHMPGVFKFVGELMQDHAVDFVFDGYAGIGWFIK